MFGSLPRYVVTMLIAAAPLLAACSSKAPAAPIGGAVTGAKDKHCTGMPSQPTDQSACHVTMLPADAGAGTGGGGPEYGATMYNQEGDDDDCKYHVSWTSTPISNGADVTFTMSGTYKANGTPNPPAMAGGPIIGLDTSNFYVEIGYSDPTHAPPPTNEVVTASSTPGTYSIGPVIFDKPGQWFARFHLFEACADVLPDSPHGHAAFYINIPE
jgi:hypothetical protein